MFPVEHFKLPQNSVIHMLDFEKETYSVVYPTFENIFLKNYDSKTKIPIEFPEELTHSEGAIVNNKIIVRKESQKWLSKDRRFIRAKEDYNYNPNTPIIEDYNLLKLRYRYPVSLTKMSSVLDEEYEPGSSYIEHKNLMTSFFDILNKKVKEHPDKLHHFVIETPVNFYSINIYERLSKMKPILGYRSLRNHKNYFLYQLIIWLDINNRDKSYLHALDEESLSKIYITIKHKNYFTVLRLDILYSLLNTNKLPSKTKFDTRKVQIIANKFFFNISRIADALEEEKKQQTDQQTDNEDGNEDSADSSEEGTDEEADIIKNTSYSHMSGILKGVTDIKEDDDLDAEITEDVIETDDDLIDLSEEDVADDTDSSDEESKQQHPEAKLSSLDEKDINVHDAGLEEKLNRHIDHLIKNKLATSAQIRELRKLYQNRKAVKDPYTKEQLLDEFIKIRHEDVEITENDKKLPVKAKFIKPSMAQETTRNLDSHYIKKVHKKDLISSIYKLEDAGLIIKEHKIDHEISKLGHYEVHSVKIKPLDGQESTIYFKLPKIDENGEMLLSGVNVRLRKQRSDLPIRKIAYNKVALNSYYGKTFIESTEKKAYDYYSYLINYIKDSYIGKKESSLQVKKLLLGHLYDNKVKEPAILSALKKNFLAIELVTSKDSYTFNFDREAFNNQLDPEYKTLTDPIPVGYNSKKEIIALKSDETFVNLKTQENLGRFEDLLEIDHDRLPMTYSTIKLMGEDVPLGPVIAFHIGLIPMIKYLKTSVKIVESSKRTPLEKYEYKIRFADYSLILDRRNYEHMLLFSGFYYFKDFIKNYNLEDFDHKDIYYNMLDFRNYNIAVIKEMEVSRDLFIDPITKQILQDMGEPTDYIPLLLRANAMLTTYDHPDLNDMAYSRIKGYERVAGSVYRTLAESVRAYKFKRTNKRKVELSPYEVWNSIAMDNAKKLVEDINPIVYAKETEAVTLAGSDGLNKDNVKKDLREYHASDMGVISESTVDNSDVGVNAFMTPYARLKDVRGRLDTTDTSYKEDKFKLFSTSALLAPFTDHDDPKRVNFIGIQNGHTIAVKGAHQPLVRTSYEYVLPYRMKKLYTAVAEDDGKVIEETDKYLLVQYKDGKRDKIKLGSIISVAAGNHIKHNIISVYRKGQTFKKGDIIAYNDKFFERDWLDKTVVIPKISKTSTVAFAVTNDVFEDGCSISRKLSDELQTEYVHVVKKVIGFDKEIVDLVKVGDHVEPNSTLFTVIEPVGDTTNLTPEALQLLKNLSNLSPKAKIKGYVSKIEINYNGDYEDMSPSIRKIARMLDKEIEEETKDTDMPIKNNKVGFEYRVDGNNLADNTLELKIYLVRDLEAAVGDKIVFGHQLKSIISNVYDGKIYNEDNEEVDAIFGYLSVMNRITLSPILLGTTTYLLKRLSKKVVEIYNSK